MDKETIKVINHIRNEYEKGKTRKELKNQYNSFSEREIYLLTKDIKKRVRTRKQRSNEKQVIFELKVIDICNDYLQERATIRSVAEKHNLSHQTIYKYLSYQLPKIDKVKFEKVNEKLTTGKCYKE